LIAEKTVSEFMKNSQGRVLLSNKLGFLFDTKALATECMRIVDEAIFKGLGK
jgi:hypothetical protein